MSILCCRHALCPLAYAVSLCPTRQRPSAWACTRLRSLGHAAKTHDAHLELPLAERAEAFSERPQKFLSWYQTAVQATKLTAPAFDREDDPSLSELLVSAQRVWSALASPTMAGDLVALQRELDWLLEDAVGLRWRSLRLRGSVEGEDPLWKVKAQPEELARLWHRRLVNREPLQYLTNAAYWRDTVLAIGPGVLIPRPETECLVDFAAEAGYKHAFTLVPDASYGLQNGSFTTARNAPLSQGIWADLGTGSGALAIGLALTIADLKEIWAVDASSKACAWASLNVNRLNLDAKIHVRQGSWFEPLQNFKGQLSGILSNPPYIEPHIVPTLQEEVRLHEPVSALSGGSSDGLECLQSICTGAGSFLKPGGFLGLETGGKHQTRPVTEMLEAEFCEIRTRQDMFGVERFVTAKRR